jgi:hypothetical protein
LAYEIMFGSVKKRAQTSCFSRLGQLGVLKYALHIGQFWSLWRRIGDMLEVLERVLGT